VIGRQAADAIPLQCVVPSHRVAAQTAVLSELIPSFVSRRAAAPQVRHRGDRMIQPWAHSDKLLDVRLIRSEKGADHSHSKREQRIVNHNRTKQGVFGILTNYLDGLLRGRNIQS
jgi:hypothetical protein